MSDVYLTEAGAALYADLHGHLPQPRAEAMLRILVEELRRRGVSGHVTTAPGSALGDRVWEPPRVAMADVEPEPQRAYYVCRTVMRMTTTGKPYQDTEYWAGSTPADGDRWIRDRTLAVAFEEVPLELVAELRARYDRFLGQPHPRYPNLPGYGQVTACLLPTDGADTRPMPPPELRQDD